MSDDTGAAESGSVESPDVGLPKDQGKANEAFAKQRQEITSLKEAAEQAKTQIEEAKANAEQSVMEQYGLDGLDPSHQDHMRRHGAKNWAQDLITQSTADLQRQLPPAPSAPPAQQTVDPMSALHEADPQTASAVKQIVEGLQAGQEERFAKLNEVNEGLNKRLQHQEFDALQAQLNQQVQAAAAEYPDVFGEGATDTFAMDNLMARIRGNTDANARIPQLVGQFAEGARGQNTARENAAKAKRTGAKRGQSAGEGAAVHEPRPLPELDANKTVGRQDHMFNQAKDFLAQQMDDLDLSTDQ